MRTVTPANIPGILPPISLLRPLPPHQLQVGAAVKGKRVVIIDDVITAGTAAREAANLLTKAGAVRAACWQFCRTFVFAFNRIFAVAYRTERTWSHSRNGIHSSVQTPYIYPVLLAVLMRLCWAIERCRVHYDVDFCNIKFLFLSLYLSALLGLSISLCMHRPKEKYTRSTACIPQRMLELALVPSLHPRTFGCNNNTQIQITSCVTRFHEYS